MSCLFLQSQELSFLRIAPSVGPFESMFFPHDLPLSPVLAGIYHSLTAQPALPELLDDRQPNVLQRVHSVCLNAGAILREPEPQLERGRSGVGFGRGLGSVVVIVVSGKGSRLCGPELTVPGPDGPSWSFQVEQADSDTSAAMAKHAVMSFFISQIVSILLLCNAKLRLRWVLCHGVFN
jgi:hypothetical protein